MSMRLKEKKKIQLLFRNILIEKPLGKCPECGSLNYLCDIFSRYSGDFNIKVNSAGSSIIDIQDLNLKHCTIYCSECKYMHI